MPIPEILKGTYDSLLAESSAAVLFHAAHIEAQEKSREIAQITERFLTQARQYLAKNTSHVGRSYAQAFENVITTYIQSKQGERMAKQWLDANRLSVDVWMRIGIMRFHVMALMQWMRLDLGHSRDN